MSQKGMSEEEDACMAEEDACMSEEDACMSHEKEYTCMKSGCFKKGMSQNV
jgi:hypothetical protein